MGRMHSHGRDIGDTLTMEMKEATYSDQDQLIKKDASQLVSVLKEMKEGLNVVTSKVQALTAKVKGGSFPTADGISYLDVKNLLLLSYCQSLVYYLLHKAKGLPIERHPVVKSLVEIRLFLEKIRAIDKKHEYQIQKLTRDSGRATELVSLKEKESEASEKSENPLAFRPNPDGLISKLGPASKDDVYQPPKIAPVIMREDKTSKQERDALRRGTEIVRKSSQGYVKELLNNIEGRPEEVKDHVDTDSLEYQRFQRNWDERERQEEESFMRVPLTKLDKRKQKQLEKSRNGLRDLTDGFFDEIKTLPLGDDSSELPTNFGAGNRGVGKFKKRKRRH